MRSKSRREYLKVIGTSTGAGLVGFSGCLSGSGNGTEGGSSGPVKIGIPQMFSGQYSWVGNNIWDGARTARKQIQDAGGIGDAKLQLEKADTKQSVDGALAATQELLNVKEVDALVGYSSFTIMGVHERVTKAKKPLLHPAGIPKAGGINSDYIYRVAPSDLIGGRAIGLVPAKQDGFDTMALMAGQASGLQGFKKPIKNAYTNAGGSITTTVDFQVNKSSYDSEVNSALSDDPDGVWVIGQPQDTAKIMEVAFQQGYEGEFVVTDDQTNKEFLELTDAKVTDGTLAATPGGNAEATQAGRVEEFEKNIVEVTGNESGAFSMNAYDGVTIQALAAKAAMLDDGEVTGETINNHIRDIAMKPGTKVRSFPEGAEALDNGDDINYDGLASPFEFDEQGNIASDYFIQQVQNNEWTQVGNIPAEELTL